MIKKSFKWLRVTVLAAAAALSLTAVAENGILSPYSRIGYGIMRDNATSAQKGLGGTGYAMNSGRQINVMNPASYAAIDSLTFLFDMGIDLTSVWQSENQDGRRITDSNFGGGLDYITMQFPLGKYMGGSVGMLPYSSVGYAFGSDIDNGYVSRAGSGSINELYLGVAGRPFRGFTIGANVAYLFGTTYKDTYATSNDAGTILFERQLEVRDYKLEFGAQYGFNINPLNRLTVGLVYAPKKDLHGHAETYSYKYDSNNPSPELTDRSRLQGNYSLAESWGAGINWQWSSRWMVEADFTYQPWSKAKFDGDGLEEDLTRMANRYRGGFGIQLMPAQRGPYYKVIRYRLGAFYDRDYQTVQANNVREYGITAGFGLPVPSFKTVINLAFEWRHREAYPARLISENYLNISIGVNFNEMWFRQNKLR